MKSVVKKRGLNNDGILKTWGIEQFGMPKARRVFKSISELFVP